MRAAAGGRGVAGELAQVGRGTLLWLMQPGGIPSSILASTSIGVGQVEELQGHLPQGRGPEPVFPSSGGGRSSSSSRCAEGRALPTTHIDDAQPS